MKKKADGNALFVLDSTRPSEKVTKRTVHYDEHPETPFPELVLYSPFFGSLVSVDSDVLHYSEADPDHRPWSLWGSESVEEASC